jgi:hypothetical protein
VFRGKTTIRSAPEQACAPKRTRSQLLIARATYSDTLLPVRATIVECQWSMRRERRKEEGGRRKEGEGGGRRRKEEAEYIHSGMI